MTRDKREKRIVEMMVVFGLSRPEAELAVAIELGESTGDAIAVDEHTGRPVRPRRATNKSG